MKTKSLVIIGLIVGFVLVIGWALLREIGREERTLRTSISGVVEVAPRLFAAGLADVVRTDRLVLILVHPKTREIVVLRFESPLVPPMNIRIGQQDARDGTTLAGPYLVVGITDKDGEIFRVTPGEVYGRSKGPVALGTEGFRLVLDQPFRGSLFNDAMAIRPARPKSASPPARKAPAGAPEPRFSISGTITVTKALSSNVAPTDRLVLLMFDPELGRPVANKIIPHTLLPQRFTISLPPSARQNAKKGYFLRILTDKDNNPFGSAPGEVIGRSARPVPLGTTGLKFVLDQDYVKIRR